jgi:hypothetical protein
LLAAGCVGEEAGAVRVSPGAFGDGPVLQRVARPNFAPASPEVAQRVAALGGQIIDANQSVGLRPVFTAVGLPVEEVFHRGTAEVLITEGLVQRCAGDGQLAALLCLELGRMVAEREAATPAAVRQPERLPPIDVPVGNDQGGARGTPDRTHEFELLRFEREQPRHGQPAPPPAPEVLARGYLQRAGFAPSELTEVAPLLAAVEAAHAAPAPLRAAPPAADTP